MPGLLTINRIIHYVIKQHESISPFINLWKQIFSNIIHSHGLLISIQVFNLINSCIQHMIFIFPEYWDTIRISQTFCYSGKISIFFISWKCYLHIHICVFKHLWCKIICFQNISIIKYPFKSSAKLGPSSNIPAQSCELDLDPQYSRLSDFSLWRISVSKFTKVSLNSSVDNSIFVTRCTVDLDIKFLV